MTSYRQRELLAAKEARRQEREAKRDDKLAVIDAKCSLYNANVDKLEPFMRSYWRAIKEAWQRGITRQEDDKSFLHAHGVMERCRYGYGEYYWHPELAALNKAMR